MITALIVEVGKPPAIAKIEPSLKTLCTLIGEAEAKQIDKNIYIIFNKDRFLSGFEANRKINNDIICGTFYVIATDENGHLISLTLKELEKYSKQFWFPQKFSYEETVQNYFDILEQEIFKNE